MQQQVVGPPTMETYILGIQIAHLTLGTNGMDPKMFLGQWDTIKS